MVELKKEQLSLIAPFYAHMTDTMILSVLQGKQGRAWADHAEKPQAALLYLGGFGFPAGRPDSDLLSPLPVKSCILAPPDSGWEQLAERLGGEKHTRFAIRKEGDVFDRQRLRGFLRDLPKDTELKRIDKELYSKSLHEEWSEDLCANFASAEDFLKNGIGYMVLLNGKPVSGVSSFSYYDKGIEIEIDTHPDYRRRGFALACAAQIILYCLENNLYPSWDAHNPGSVALAEKLGYHPGESYSVYYFFGEEKP